MNKPHKDQEFTEGERLKDALRASDELFQGVFNQAAVGIAITGPDRKVLQANRKICDFLGYQFEELVGTTLRAATHPDFVPRVDEQIRKLVDGQVESATIENIYLRKDGTTVWGEWTSSLVRDECGAPKYFISVIQNIDDRKGAEAKAEKTRRMLEHSQRVAHLGSWDLDIVEDKERWSDEVYRIFGLEPQSIEFDGYGFLAYVHPEDREVVKSAQDTAISQHKPYSVEYRLIRPDGTERTVYEYAELEFDDHGAPTRLSGTIQDTTERKQAEFALQRTTKKLEDAQRIGHVGHWERDPDSEKSEWSEEIFRIFGLNPKSEPPSSPVFLQSILHQADRIALERAMTDTLRTGNPYAIEFRIVRPDGEVRTIFEHGERYIPEETGRPIIRGVLQDITELKQAEGNLREVSRRLELAQKQARVGYWRWSFEEECLTYWSREAAEICRYVQDEGPMNYGQLMEAIHPNDRSRVQAEFAAADLERRDFSVEYRIVGDEGEITHVREIGEVEYDGSGVAVAHVGFVQDITELKQMEESLRKSEQQLNAFFAEAPAGLTLYDREGRYVRANDTIARINGIPAEAHIGKRPSEILPPALGQEIEEANRRTLETGARMLNVEVSAPLPLGQADDSHFVYSRFPIPGPEGEPLGVGAVIVDITERKRAEEELSHLNAELEARVDERTAALKAAQKELVHSERMATLGQLTATVSHELRNPLGAMRTSMYVIEKMLDSGDPRLMQAISRVQRNITRCDQIIDELLDYTRIRGLDIKAIHIDGWLRTVLDEQPVPKDVLVERKHGAGSTVVPMDPDRLLRAIINVYDNACQAMTDPLRNGEPRHRPRLIIETRIRNGRVEMTFTDNGPGIPEGEIEQIFEPLFSTKNFGVGLGLPVVRQIMEQHGGGVEVDKRQKDGARFMLWLPLRETGIPAG